jgi:transposase InsO family protein
MCRLLRVSRGGFYAWSRRPCSAAQKRRQKLLEQIKQAFNKSRRTYGSWRVTADLNARQIKVCRNTVAKLMHFAGLSVRPRRRFVPRTTDSKHDHPIAANVLNRDFDAAAPDTKWLADITYVPTDEGYLYLAAVLDAWSRKIIGWNMEDHLQSDLVSEALRMALLNREPKPGLIHHSDRGVQYACADHRRLLHAHGLIPSMSRIGNCYDNAPMESFFGTLKSELVNEQRYATRAQARGSIFEYIEGFYNRQRRHSTLGYKTPEEFEKDHAKSAVDPKT